MIRLHITTEGRSELQFVKEIVAPHLGQFNIATDARPVLTSRDNRTNREYRGGLGNYEKAKNDILRWLKEDNHPECRFTTMFDFYGLPNNFPGYASAISRQDAYEKIRILEAALEEDICDDRFIPYIQLHEFETLILADAQQLDWEYLENDKAIANLIAEVGNQNPELINDGPATAPSMRGKNTRIRQGGCSLIRSRENRAC